LAENQKKGRRRQAVIVFLDETGFLLQPLNRRTWAPRGETPIQYASARHDRLSVIGAVTLSPQRHRISTYWQFYENNVVATDVVAFLRSLHRQQRRELIVVLDRFNVHRKAIRLLKESGATWLCAEWLPAYAPDLNPVEALWSCTKYGDLANFTPDDLDDLGNEIGDSFARQSQTSALKKSYFQTAKLQL
jgi:transposase